MSLNEYVVITCSAGKALRGVWTMKRFFNTYIVLVCSKYAPYHPSYRVGSLQKKLLDSLSQFGHYLKHGVFYSGLAQYTREMRNSLFITLDREFGP